MYYFLSIKQDEMPDVIGKVLDGHCSGGYST